MDYKKLGAGLGLFSIALGAAELIAGRRIARRLGSEDAAGLVRAFGARELAAGAGLMLAPAHSAMVWNRVLGDGMDLAALGVAARRRPSNKAAWGAIGMVAAVTAIDILTALGLGRSTGKTLPIRTGGENAEASHGRATSIEPPVVSRATAPTVG